MKHEQPEQDTDQMPGRDLRYGRQRTFARTWTSRAQEEAHDLAMAPDGTAQCEGYRFLNGGGGVHTLVMGEGCAVGRL
jgi:hypothetical protein